MMGKHGSSSGPLAINGTLFGPRLAEIRKSRGLSQARLAKKVGTTQPQISRFERTGRLPTVRSLARLALALRVQIGDLLAAPGTPHPA
jgi:transcriptional regulator with XRE-family HTH domain